MTEPLVPSLGARRQVARSRLRALILITASALGCAGCARGAGPLAEDAGTGAAWPTSSRMGSPGAAARAPTGPSIRVMTYNVNYGLEGDAAGVEAIADAAADLVLLQETTAGWEAALRSALGPRYPYVAFRDCCGAGGLAVLSKYPFEEKDYLHAARAWFPAWRFVVASPLGPLQILNVHLHPQISESGSVVSGVFTTPAVRESEIAEYYERLDPSLPTLIAGDFNESHTGSAIEFLRTRGMQTALAAAKGAEPTWHWPTSFGTVYAELDHLVHDARLRPREASVLRVGRSDHFPVVAVFHARPTPASTPAIATTSRR